MKAKKCDRCGRFYDITEESYDAYINIGMAKGIFLKESTVIDLCQHCYNEMMTYLKNPNTIVCSTDFEEDD